MLGIFITAKHFVTIFHESCSSFEVVDIFFPKNWENEKKNSELCQQRKKIIIDTIKMKTNNQQKTLSIGEFPLGTTLKIG